MIRYPTKILSILMLFFSIFMRIESASVVPSFSVRAKRAKGVEDLDVVRDG